MGAHLDLDDVAAGHPMALAELAALRKDAERYRWLRSSGATISYTRRPREKSERVEVDAGLWTRRETLDAAIDAAMAQPEAT